MTKDDGIQILKKNFIFYKEAFEELKEIDFNTKVHIENDKIVKDNFNFGFYRYIYGYNRNDIYEFLNIHLRGYLNFLRQLDLSHKLDKGTIVEKIRALKFENSNFINKIHSGLFNFTLIYKDDNRFKDLITYFDNTYQDYLKL